MRNISFEISDGAFVSNTLQGRISIALIDDNELIHMCGGSYEFMEGSSVPVNIGSSVIVSDSDVDHVITGADILVIRAMEGDIISLSSGLQGLNVTNVNDTFIRISGNSNALMYQVRKVCCVCVLHYHIMLCDHYTLYLCLLINFLFSSFSVMSLHFLLVLFYYSLDLS